MTAQALQHDVAEAAAQSTLRRLGSEWTAFEARLSATPLLQRLERGRLSIEDYRAFLSNLRQQVKEGACWIARAASNVSEPYLELRTILLRHATAEHRDFLLLEDDFVAACGRREAIVAGEKNVGSEALSAWMYHEASKPDPFGLLGAMWIIEGLGSIKAKEWGEAIVRQLKLPREAASFLLYHGENDETHLKEFQAMLRLVCGVSGVPDRIVKTARVTGRLYALQIEEIEG